MLDIGAKFNNLTVVSQGIEIEIGHKHFMHKYLCKCVCGNEIDVFEGELVSGHIKSCGCVTKICAQPLTYDLLGQRFGKLTVLDQAETFWSDSGKSRMIRWNCVCDCGNHVTVNSRVLRTGQTLSCGCYQKQRVSEALTDDLSGQRFGKLTVISRAGSYRKSLNVNSGISATWLCRCDCGNEIETMGWSLKCGDTVSCGCAKRSQAEECIEQILNENNYVKDVTYFTEKTFSDLISDSGGYLRFDFAIPCGDNWILVECQGEQHYKSVKYFGGDDSFERRKVNDARKKRWIDLHGYTLIEIPFTVRGYDNYRNILLKNNLLN